MSFLNDCLHAVASPLKKLLENLKFDKLGSLQTFSGTKPVSLFCVRSNLSTLFNPDKLSGKVPTKELEAAFRTVTLVSVPISDGKQPPSLLLAKTISFNVLDIFPMVLGMQPWNLLFANTTTETGDSPRVSGMVEVKRLLFKNNASSFISKSS